MIVGFIEWMFFPLAPRRVTIHNKITSYTVTRICVTCQEFNGGYMARPSQLHGKPAGALNLIGGRLCLDFLNSVGARRISQFGEITIRDETLNDYLDLLAWGRHARALTKAEVETLAHESRRQQKEAAAVFHRAIRLREALYSICKAKLSHKQPRETDLLVLNEELRLARDAEQLVFEKTGFDWQWSTPDSALDRVLLPIARSAAELLTQDDLSRLRQCGGDDCGWIFLDTSRNRGRRWCDMRDCGNVAKVRRFRHRLSAAH
jgi:predicted RNA-binding Zn ribbon-like protein